LSADERFFLGTDSAPHYLRKKKLPDPKPGIFNAPVAIPLILEFFAERECLHLLENFTSGFMADFYGLERSRETIRVYKKSWEVSREYKGIPIFKGGQTIGYSL